jgi:hypothetical protein
MVTIYIRFLIDVFKFKKKILLSLGRESLIRILIQSLLVILTPSLFLTSQQPSVHLLWNSTYQVNSQNCRFDVFVDVLRCDLSHRASAGRVSHLAQADGSHVETLRFDAHTGKVAPNVLMN